MKLISSLALAAALLFSSAAADFSKCPGNEPLFDFYEAEIKSESTPAGTINPNKEICLTIKGYLKTDLPLTGPKVKFSAENPKNGDMDRSWESELYSSLRYPEGTELPYKRGERVLRTCSYLPPDYMNTPSGANVVITAEFTSKDSEGDYVRVLCVKGSARVA